MEKQPAGQDGHSDEEILGLLDENVREWCIRQLEGRFTPPQRMAVPLIHDGKNVLICSPTGSGKTLSAFLATLRAECEVVLVTGSHDTMLPSVAGGTVERYDRGGYTVVHADQAVDDHGTLIIGHDHPAIEIDMARFPCFLYGQGAVRGKDLIVMPAANPLSPGVIINAARSQDFLSPILRRVDAGSLQPVVEVDGEAVVLPPLAGIRRFA